MASDDLNSSVSDGNHVSNDEVISVLCCVRFDKVEGDRTKQIKHMKGRRKVKRERTVSKGKSDEEGTDRP